MNEVEEKEDWDVLKLDSNNWLEIPDFGVQPGDVRYSGFSHPLVLAGHQPDQLITSMRWMPPRPARYWHQTRSR